MMLLDISTWWNSLATFDQIFWAIALFFSLLFVIQTVLSFIAGDGDEAFGDADAAVDGDDGIGYGVFTIKNFIAFFTVFGWTGIAMIRGGNNKLLTIAAALVAGILVVAIMAFLFRAMSKLKHSGTMDISNAVGKTAETYLIIPAGRKGFGKIHIHLQGSIKELQAITDDLTDIPTGRIVQVRSVINGNLLLVSAQLS